MGLFNSRIASSNGKKSIIANEIIATEHRKSSKRALFLATCHRQTWSLPDTIFYYITNNPSSSKCYTKMILTCKYFFVKNPILITKWFLQLHNGNEWHTSGFGGKCLDLNNISAKIWITEKYTAKNVYDNNQCFDSSSIVSKIFQCDIKELSMIRLNISFDNLKFLASKCEEVFFNDLAVINEDGSTVRFEEIVRVLPNVKKLKIYFDDNYPSVITSKTVQQLIKIPHFSSMTDFTFGHIPEKFDINCFYDYIKKNDKTKICLFFCDQLSDAYKNRLQEIANEIIATEYRKFKVPLIHFSDIDQTTFVELHSLRMQS